MHKIYFTRHGETVWNVENKICGMTDSPLTERGRQQARQLGERVKASGVHKMPTKMPSKTNADMPDSGISTAHQKYSPDAAMPHNPSMTVR